MHLGLTDRSSRTPEVPFPGSVVDQFPPTSGLHVGGRLNYGVRHIKEPVYMSIQSPKLAGFLFLAAGLVFFVAAVLGGFVAEKPAFFSFLGVGAAFLALGAAYLRKAKGPAP